MKKILCIVLLLILPITFLCSCRKEIVDGDFVYEEFISGNDICYIMSLSNEGIKKDRIIIPSNRNSQYVFLGRKFYTTTSNFGGKTIFFDSTVITSNMIKMITIDIDKLIFMSTDYDIENYEPDYNYYFSSFFYSTYGDELNYANVNYYYNYEDSPNRRYYFLDDYDDELISYIPEDPIREGYTFKGWYKESECINKWDFTTDKVEAKEYIDDGYQYKETALYAKWELA
ncbi:MAG: InlB B-repeat-containing protein [Anaeroplasmataceae bacterium]